MLRDCLVCGCQDKQLDWTLLAQQELTFDTTFKMVCAMEMAEEEVRDLYPDTSQSVHAVHSGDAVRANAHPLKEQSPAIVVVRSICPEPAIQDCHLSLLS